MNSILLVEDQDQLREALKIHLEFHGLNVDEAATLREATGKISERDYDVIILDLKLPGGNSICLFDSHPEKLAGKTIIITANATIPGVVEAIKKGAFNYLEKPVDEDLLLAQVKKVIEINHIKLNYRLLKSQIASTYSFDSIIYFSRQMEEIISRAKILAQIDNTVLIQGETGVGKEVIAQSIHRSSPRHGQVFLPVNCASIPGELFESELFGFEKGAFTGAVHSYNGRFIQADQGTLFLDEVGELPLSVQAKLLRILDEKIIYPLKSSKPHPVDIRLFAATNRDLEEAVNGGTFRQDLYYRLMESTLYIPPLRERTEDILPLARHFVAMYNQVYDKAITKISMEAETHLLNYPWRGNVRELRNTLKSIIPFKKDNTIGMADFSYSIIAGKQAEEKQFTPLEENEKNYIRKVLKATDYNITHAAEILGIHRQRLYRKIKYYRLEDEIQ